MEIVSELEKGNVIWSRPFANAIHGNLARNYCTGRPYEGFNQFYLTFKTLSKGYRTPQFITFKQAQDLGGHIRKGEKGSVIIFWKIVEKEVTDQKKQTHFYPFCYYVFNIDQVEGIELKIPLASKEDPAVASNQVCQTIIQQYPNCPKITHKETTPFYTPTQDIVNIPPAAAFKTASLYYSVLFHELIHSTGHETRLNRFVKGQKPAAFGSPEYSKEELIAEIGAAFLCGTAGIYPDTRHHNTAYLNSWIKALENDATMIISAANKALKAASYILGFDETETESNETIPVAASTQFQIAC